MDDAYRTFIRFLFDRDEAAGDWRFAFDLEEPDFEPEQIVTFIGRMLDNCAADLAPYSDWQLGLGMDFVFNNSCSDYSIILRDGSVDLQQRTAAILALKNFFCRYLDTRCQPSLGHLSEAGNELNHFCYMLWDTTPLSYCEGVENGPAIYAAVAEVMRYSLDLDNIACIESGLHGLGHLGSCYPPAKELIEAFIERTAVTDARLLQYARNARSGCVL